MQLLISHRKPSLLQAGNHRGRLANSMRRAHTGADRVVGVGKHSPGGWHAVRHRFQRSQRSCALHVTDGVGKLREASRTALATASIPGRGVQLPGGKIARLNIWQSHDGTCVVIHPDRSRAGKCGMRSRVSASSPGCHQALSTLEKSVGPTVYVSMLRTMSVPHTQTAAGSGDREYNERSRLIETTASCK
nr:hypothetical protein CFP56_32300 [Quercus suber]